jgi:predicted nucleotidyltransferase
MRHSVITDALFPRTRQRVLGVLLMNATRPWYAAELARHLGIRRSSLQRDLSRLTAAGLLKRSQNGNRVCFQADESSPVFPELRSLFLKTVGLVEVLREELLPLAKNIRVACVYGSITAGTEGPSSDVDLLIIGSISLMDLVPLLERMTQQLQRQVNPTLLSPEEFKQKVREGNRFLQSVLGKPVLFVIGTSDDLAAIAGRKARREPADGSR